MLKFLSSFRKRSMFCFSRRVLMRAVKAFAERDEHFFLIEPAPVATRNLRPMLVKVPKAVSPDEIPNIKKELSV